MGVMVPHHRRWRASNPGLGQVLANDSRPSDCLFQLRRPVAQFIPGVHRGLCISKHHYTPIGMADTSRPPFGKGMRNGNGSYYSTHAPILLPPFPSSKAPPFGVGSSLTEAQCTTNLELLISSAISALVFLIFYFFEYH